MFSLALPNDRSTTGLKIFDFIIVIIVGGSFASVNRQWNKNCVYYVLARGEQRWTVWSTLFSSQIIGCSVYALLNESCCRGQHCFKWEWNTNRVLHVLAWRTAMDSLGYDNFVSSCKRSIGQHKCPEKQYYCPERIEKNYIPWHDMERERRWIMEPSKEILLC